MYKMLMMKGAALAAILSGMGFVPSTCGAVEHQAPPSVIVESVQFRQRYPWNGLVDIDAKISCSDANTNLAVYVAAWDNVKDRALTVKTIWVDGDEAKNSDLTVKSGMRRIVWDARADNPNEISQSVSVSVQAYVRDMRYMVIDLSGGTNATEYACSYRAEPSKGGWTDEYKTTKLVLRLIPAGMFIMGSPENETGHNCGYECVETQHKVAITKPFYAGVFEVTQKQYELVMGKNPSVYKGDPRPVERLCYNDIRGSDNGAHWPSDSLVDCDTFLGRIRAKTGRMIDLPTEAQWEYACRAGTTTALNSGKNVYDPLTGNDNMFELGRYGANTNDWKGGYQQHTTVGSYKPNAWGLYDMHGNVAEWCKDWVASDLGVEAVEDPAGPNRERALTKLFGPTYNSDSSYGPYAFRILRGGQWRRLDANDASRCRSAWRDIVVYGNVRRSYRGGYYGLVNDYIVSIPQGAISSCSYLSPCCGFRAVVLLDSEMAAAVGGL